jgi:hypothetical protein
MLQVGATGIVDRWAKITSLVTIRAFVVIFNVFNLHTSEFKQKFLHNKIKIIIIIG